jgi:hypothetical protein
MPAYVDPNIAQRLLKVAEAKSRQALPNGSNDELILYQLGFLAGWLGRVSQLDQTVLNELYQLEELLGV